MSGFQDFDRWLEARGIPFDSDDVPEYFAQFLADESGESIIAGPVGEAPSVVAVPEACDNHWCHDGWVAWGNNESGAAPSVPCLVCRRRVAR